MNGRDRRTIHISVREYEGVATMSIGEGRFRQVVVVPQALPSTRKRCARAKALPNRAERTRPGARGGRSPDGRACGRCGLFHVEPFHVELRAISSGASGSWGRHGSAQLERWEKLALLLERWSERINLTGHRGALAIAERLLSKPRR